MLRRKAWSPYLCGILIGLLQIPAYLFARSFLGSSSSYVKVVGHFFSLLGIKTEAFSQFLHSTEFGWQLALVVGIVIGARLSSTLSGSRRKEPSAVWGPQPKAKRYLTAAGGGFLLIVGARLAGGCTSGHGISGAAQFSASSWIAVSMMFAGGIGFSLLRRRQWLTSSSV